ncbi:methionyl-tRNA formyltransferase [Candidatus Kirkpatrickella diaphorinae]|uniref:Methionyl-tRNA formyltransferase n=1 Tax=Candidatus Kirkpatrickella diaphorinae TaxID=2984322 RepID=A0ABY6GML8_9PROT|nr:methionyl-tRNA formyltransferase [Candidatus Kirkpatrickella diaphorinae]UYH52180.1 methionyl-tRNA formyltransferase [Candidatus Kirkpatrickella diaphorinae]
MRLIFMGTPAFSVPVLDALRAAGHEIVAVYTQPPRPSGRGKKLQLSPVHQAAEAAHLPVMTPSKLRDEAEELKIFIDFQADAAIVVAYGIILPPAFLTAPRLGCINVHASLLPRWRGAAPIQAAIMAGDAQTGISIMQMDAGLDTGPVLSMAPIPIAPDETGASLHDKLSALGAKRLIDTLNAPLQATPQSDQGASYAARLTRETGRIDWSLPAETLERRIRALTPWPSSFTTYDGTTLKIGGAMVVQGVSSAQPGVTLDDALTVQCGQDALRLTHIQRPGKAMLTQDMFLRGWAVPRGSRFE